MFPNNSGTDANSPQQTLNTAAQVILAFVGVAGLLKAMFDKDADLPVWLVTLFIVFGVIGLALLLWKPATKGLLAWRRRTLSSRLFPDLVRLVDRFSLITSPQRSDTIIAALANIQRREEWRGTEVQYNEYSQLVALLMSNMYSRIRSVRHTFSNFESISNDLCSIVRSYQMQYFFLVFQKLRQKGVAAVGEDNKRTIDVAREEYQNFLNALDEFCKVALERSKSNVFNVYFSKVEPF